MYKFNFWSRNRAKKEITLASRRGFHCRNFSEDKNTASCIRDDVVKEKVYVSCFFWFIFPYTIKMRCEMIWIFWITWRYFLLFTGSPLVWCERDAVNGRRSMMRHEKITNHCSASLRITDGTHGAAFNYSISHTAISSHVTITQSIKY